MSLADRFSGSRPPSPSSSREISCPRYEPLPGSKRCQHYVKGGGCALPDEFMCVEWLKANGHSAPAPSRPGAQSMPEASTNRSAVPADIEAEPRHEPSSPADPGFEVPVVRQLTDEDIASFKALGVEACLSSEASSELWLVPEYTGRTDRMELSVQDAATLAAICSAFPGARVLRMTKRPPKKKT